MAERWLSVEEIAEHLGVKKDTIYKWVRTTDIPFHKIGRLVKFQINAVDQWVKDGKAAPGGKENDKRAKSSKGK
jgi:excisionase family DNA binding protein